MCDYPLPEQYLLDAAAPSRSVKLGSSPQNLAKEADQATPTTTNRSRQERIKDAAAIAQSIATVLAIITAAFLYFQRQQAVPRANLSHAVTHRKLDAHWTWIRLEVIITNVGEVPILSASARAWVQQILPLPPGIGAALARNQTPIPAGEILVPWPYDDEIKTISSRRFHLGSDESDQIEFEFLVPSDRKTVRLYSNVTIPPPGFLESIALALWREPSTPVTWKHTSIYEIKETQ